ncbi:breast carcinoma-amplified sequence 3-like [Tropilaelaps mercedesae]|uniref:Breast carcinoma-amplified sequence 3-like n=1 Tax=Tropilaelaps mercedesae TaxID=418985 RepID=A0A1V9XKZ1_9ACAR|nr:breast carcinoma-amplified sequence 3-like [Tropilaelaps mercedesae]
MSALGTRSTGCGGADQVISPTLVERCDKREGERCGSISYVDSVVGMISDVVPAGVGPLTVGPLVAGTGSRKTLYRSQEMVNWVKMINTDALEEAGCLVIGMGYGDGIQLFAVGSNGEARMILSRRNSSPVRDFCLVPTPVVKQAGNAKCARDAYPVERPFVVLCELNTIAILSLHTGTLRHSMNQNAQRVVASRHALVASCQLHIVILSSHDFSVLFNLPWGGPVPLAIGNRWLAYAEKTLSHSMATPGGLVSEDPASVTVTVIQTAKSIKAGLTRLGETVTGSCSPPRRTNTPFSQGIISVVDVAATDTDRMLLHFQAHRDPIAAVCFDAAGNLLMTADIQGRKFHVFRLLPHPAGSTHAKVELLYILARGDTTATVWDLAFSLDSRWAAAATARGTVHVFPIAPYGGRASVRTHMASRVVNKLSRYLRSVGVDRDADLPLIVQPAAQIRHSCNCGDTDLGSRKGDGMLLSMGFSSARACWLTNNKAPLHAPNQDSLFTVTTSGALLEYMLELRPQVSDGGTVGLRASDQETGIEVTTHPVAEWQLLIPNAVAGSATCSSGVPNSGHGVGNPGMNPSVKRPMPNRPLTNDSGTAQGKHSGYWMSQVEIATYAPPHRRLWMGPQFSFKPGHQHGGALALHDPSMDGGLIEVESSHDLIAENMADAMSEPDLPPRYQSVTMETAVPGVHSSTDSLYHSPSQSSEHLLIFEGDVESLC